MTDVVIKVENLSKRYTIRHQNGRRDGLRHAIHDFAAAPLRWLRGGVGSWVLGNGSSPQYPTPNTQHPAPNTEEFWALRGINFEVKQGEVLGIIGRNGAGKSTLLKILSRITDPTEGRVRIRGRVASLLEVGTGFHPELTGRENIFLNGAILGMSREEIRRKFDQIVDFSGVEKFIDTPVKRYSSGMYVRLAFAVAAHLEPEILIVDEVLAVGDFEFQQRCLGKMNEVATSGRTVLFVSHNMAAVEALCTNVILLKGGELVAFGETPVIVQRYQIAASDSLHAVSSLLEKRRKARNAVPIMRKVILKNADSEPATSFPMGGSVCVEVEFDAPSHLSPVLGIVVKTDTRASVFGIDNRIIDGFHFEKVQRGTIVCQIDNLPLMPGRYSIDLYFGDRHSSIDRIEDAISFSIVSADVFGTGKLPPRRCGAFYWPAKWALRVESAGAEASAIV
jgi:lipopolysaccharide transport system ATP-binding protein